MIFQVEETFPIIIELERRGLVTRTFRRLDPERQGAVIHAILEEAGENGPAGINIKRVAARAGVSIGSLYQYFGSREKLLAFVTELVVRLTVSLFNSYRPYFTDLPLAQALQVYLEGGMEWAEQDQGFTKFFVTAAYQDHPEMAEQVVRPVANVLREMCTEIVRQAEERGEVRPDLDVEATARLLNALLIAMGDARLLPYLNTYYQLYDETITPERVMTAFIQLVQRGIQKPE